MTAFPEVAACSCISSRGREGCVQLVGCHADYKT